MSVPPDWQVLEALGEDDHGRTRAVVARLGDERRFLLVRLAPGAEQEEFDHLARELELLAALDSPYVTIPVETGHEGGRLYRVTACPPGGTPARPCEEPGPGAVVSAVADAARGLAALHHTGHAHGDVRPEAVHLGPRGGLLGDLGLALPLGEEDLHGPLGCVEFMAPEVTAGGRPAPPADVWGLAAVLHHALTGRSPYGEIPDRSLTAALAHVCDPRTHRAAARLRGPLPTGVGRALRRSLDTDPTRRPSAAGLAEELDELVRVLG